jgi:hypothetical protein
MHPVGFELAIPASEGLQTHVLDRAAFICVHILVLFLPVYLKDSPVTTNVVQIKVSFNTTVIGKKRETEFLAYR